jgi:hypothetical protein
MTTIASLLFGQNDPRRALDKALGFVVGPAGRFSVAGLSLPVDDVAAAIAAILEMPVGTIALQGWKHNQQVVEARDRTRDDPDARESIRLMEHTIKSTQRPEVVMDVNGVPTPILQLTLYLEMKVSSADLLIEKGEISQITHGSSTAKAKLSAGNVVLAQHEFREADLARAESR